MNFKNLIRNITPQFLLDLNRNRKKQKRTKELKQAQSSGKSISKKKLIADLKSSGIQLGDVVLVHSSLSKIGYVEGGADTFIDALIECIGSNGTLLMPTAPTSGYQLNYIQENKLFDVLNTPSKTGIITETFRKRNGVIRSLHPTEPVAAYGPLAFELTKDHLNQLTPYNQNSPFYKITEHQGKILYVGVTLDNAGTNLHTLEDAVEFKFPVYHDEIFEVAIIDALGVKHSVKTKVHNPIFSKKRKCDELIPNFIRLNVAEEHQIGEAKTLVFDAKKMLSVMITDYQEKGITMYTPQGS